MIATPALRGLRFFSRANRNDLLGGARDAIRITQVEAAFVFGIRLNVQDAAGEHIRRGVFEERKTRRLCSRYCSRRSRSRRDADLFPLQAHQR
jgi:hypothetical protein